MVTIGVDDVPSTSCLHPDGYIDFDLMDENQHCVDECPDCDATGWENHRQYSLR